MKSIDIALKDLKQAFRNKTGLMFMFVVPILMTGLFYFIFGGTGGEDEDAFPLPPVAVQIVNLDQGEMGTIIGEIFQSEGFQDFLIVTITDSVDSARQAVDQQNASVAVIIPENFSAVLIEPQGQTEVEVYQDPTQTLGPSVVKAILNQFIDGFSSYRIAGEVMVNQLSEAGLAADPDTTHLFMANYIEKLSQVSEAQNLLNVESPTGEVQQTTEVMGIVSVVMAGMSIFYAFFTGGFNVQSILIEEERGTLPRLFTTPTDRKNILYGKFFAAALTVFIQIVVLLVIGRLVFGIQWGRIIDLAFVVVGTVTVSATFGILIISLLKNVRQAGAILGGVFTFTGMIGMAKLFTAGAPNPPPFLDIATLFVPQGWAIRGIEIAMRGGSLENILFTFGGMLAWSVVFFFIGNARFNKRFA